MYLYMRHKSMACVPLESVGATLSHLRHFQGAYKQYTRRTSVLNGRRTQGAGKTAMHAGLTVSPTCGSV